MFNTIQYFYNAGFYTKDDVNTCVPYWITQEQADQIIGANTQTTTTTANQ